MATKKQALKSNGRLKKGYRFKKGGGVVKAKKTATRRRKRR
ncbi:MAG: hypothetical protein RLO08_00265 [Parvibaculaceae bacterium]|jgi:hypothetical protein